MTSIILGEVLDILRQMPDASFDGCFSDPPYGIKYLGYAWDYSVPSVDVWREVARVLKPGAPIVAFGGARTWHRAAVALEDAGVDLEESMAWLFSEGMPKSRRKLKSAFEPILFGRKPLAGTLANNLAAHGVGGLNIEPSRIATTDRFNRSPASSGYSGMRGYERGMGRQSDKSDAGRWPPNVLLGEDVAESLGVDAKYFFCAKVGKVEGKDNPHPCRKPLALTTYLAQLIRPEAGGRLLVPYAGSGSEVLGARRAGWAEVVGIENRPDYVAIAERRLSEAA